MSRPVRSDDRRAMGPADLALRDAPMNASEENTPQSQPKPIGKAPKTLAARPMTRNAAMKHEHRKADGTTYEHAHPQGEVPHHHGEEGAGEHKHELPDGTEVIHSYDGAHEAHDH